MEQLSYANLGERLLRGKLNNGLTLYVLPRSGYCRQFAFLATRYGGIHQRFLQADGSWIDTPAGVAHFLEHKMFDSPDGSELKTFAATGAEYNAFTAADMTGYYFTCTDGFEENLRALLGLVSRPYFTQERVDKEQGIIGQEIGMCLDEPGNGVYYQLLENLYAHHPIRQELAGTVESISHITADTLYQCHGAFYRPGNMVLCVGGDVDAQLVARVAEELLPVDPLGAACTDLGERELPQAVRAYGEKEMAVSVPLFELGFKGEPPQPGESLRQRLMGELACDVLFSASAPLYSQLYEQGLINSSFDSMYDCAPGCAHIMAGGESRDPKAVMEAVLEEARRLTSEGVEPQLWERLKRAAYGSMVRRLNSLEDTCMELAQGYFEGHDYLAFPQIFQSVEWEDVAQLIARWCTPERGSLSVVRPLPGMEELEAEREEEGI